MDQPLPFVEHFPDIYPQLRSVIVNREPDLVGVLFKSIFYHKEEESLLCRGLVLRSNNEYYPKYTTVNIKVSNLNPVVGYDLDMDATDSNNWDSVRKSWSKHFTSEPVFLTVSHEDIKRKVEAAVFPMASIHTASNFMKNVRGALTFGDFCPEKGYYMTRDGNTPALCSNVMFGRMYYIHTQNLDNKTASPQDLIYDHQASEEEAKLFDACHVDRFYKAACLDIETVFDSNYRDRAASSSSFAYRFPYCTEARLGDLTRWRSAIMDSIKEGHTMYPQVKRVTIPTLPSDMPGQQHEITSVSIVMMNRHKTKEKDDKGKGVPRKTLFVVYNKFKCQKDDTPINDSEVTTAAGIDKPARIKFHACKGELALLERMVSLLSRNDIELLYVYNAEFDLRVINQRVHFYADPLYMKTHEKEKPRCEALKRAWHSLFVNNAFGCNAEPLFQFENVRFLEMYKDMLTELQNTMDRGPMSEHKLYMASMQVEKFNKEKAKLGHFKMNSCGMNVIDLYRMAGTRDIKYACTSMKLNDVTPYVVEKLRKLHKKPPKDTRKLHKVADVSYDKMDSMMSEGDKSLFAVLVYNLVDSLLCCRLAKALNPVSGLFHRCRTTLNIDVVVHGRGDTFSGFVQSIHSVQMPQLKYTMDTLRVKAGPVDIEDKSRARWDPKTEMSEGHPDAWKGGAVCEPLTGLHYSGPGMGLELSFDFSSMYPSIMCALNISPETTVPWPPSKFPHDLTGWICYSWEAEGFEYASLILKYDEDTGEYTRAPGVFASSVEHYLNERAMYKKKLKEPVAHSDADRIYFKLQEGECKVMANSFYGTAPHPCGPLISGHGRQQIAVVNKCVSDFYKHKCPVVYGDTDSVMVAVGYGPKDAVEKDVPDTVRDKELNAQQEKAAIKQFAYKAQEAMRAKAKRAGEDVPGFLKHVHMALVEDVMMRMYVIDRDNNHHKLVRDPKGALTKDGYPVFLARVPGATAQVPVTEAFVKDRRVKLEYENSCSIYCHVAKKTYMALIHTVDDAKAELSSVSVKVRGLAAFKSMRSPCDSAVTDTFIACVMKGDCVKLEKNRASCLSTAPWHALKDGDEILYMRKDPVFDETSRWTDLAEAAGFLTPHRVMSVETTDLPNNMTVVSVRLREPGSQKDVYRFSLYKDGEYCMNHIFSKKEGISRDLLTTKASEIIASKMGLGLFPWSTLIKSAKNKHFSPNTLLRLKVGNDNVKTTYVELTKSWLQLTTGLSVKPVEPYEFHKCNPCEATFYRYPLALQATSGCLTVMFGGSLACEVKSKTKAPAIEDQEEEEEDDQEGEQQEQDQQPMELQTETEAPQGEVIDHPYQPGNKCYANSRVMMSHAADRSLVNRSAKLMAHCIIDYCVPRHMYSANSEKDVVSDCEKHLVAAIAGIRERLKRANLAFTCIMNSCPEHMIPACGDRELASIMANREQLSRLPVEKILACKKVALEDIGLSPKEVYDDMCRILGEALAPLVRQGAITTETPSRGDNKIAIKLPVDMLSKAELSSHEGRLYITRNELHEKQLVDLAGIVYQTMLLLQIHNPKAFPYSDRGMGPTNTLCIMPYSIEDEPAVATWIEQFKQMEWLKVTPIEQKKPGVPDSKKQVSYHCTGCKNFYRDLFANNVPTKEVFSHVYGPDKIRRLGSCTSERTWTTSRACKKNSS